MASGEYTPMWWFEVGGAYLMLWWMTFFILLPIGMYDEDDPPGQFVLGEPPKPKAEHGKPPFSMKRKALMATAIATALWCVFYVLVLTGVISL